MEIFKVLEYNKTHSIKIKTIEGNALEALIGAIYLDGGYLSVKNSLKNHVFIKYMDMDKLLLEEIDFKSRLFIWSQKKDVILEFKVLSEVNKGLSWKYSVVVKINSQEYGFGTGSSKKKAEQVAAQKTLKLIGDQ